MIKVVHKSRDTSYELTWKVGYSAGLALVAECDGYIYKTPTLTNVSSVLINGASPTYPFLIVKGSSYTITPTITNNTQEAKATFTARKEVNSTTSIVSPTLLAENIQGTHAVFMHSADNKATIVLSSLINSSNYLGGYSWTTDPRTVINLPVVSGAVWTAGIWNHLTDRFIFFAGTATNYFHMCEYHISGAKAGQIWNIEGTVQNAATQAVVNSYQSWSTNQIFPIIDYSDDYLAIFGQRSYFTKLSTFNSNSWTFNNTPSYMTAGENLRKYHYNHKDGMFTNNTRFNKLLSSSRLYNWYNGEEAYPAGYDNVSGDLYHTNATIGIEIWNKASLVAGLSSNTFRHSLSISASVRRRMLLTKSIAYSDHLKRVDIINLDTRLSNRTEVTITETDVTTYLDGDYLNVLDMFCLVTNGTAGTTNGKRTVHYVSSSYDGVNPLLKFKLQLQYDCNYMFTNRIRY